MIGRNARTTNMTYKIIKLHGCSGAGKTTAVRELMAMSQPTPHEIWPVGATRPQSYRLDLPGTDAPTYVLGSYRSNCGGMDASSSNADDIIALVKGFHSIGHVVLEGLLLSTYYGKVGDYLAGENAVFAFLDTPAQVCLDRVVARRAANGSKNKFNPQLTLDKHATVAHLRKKCLGWNLNVVDIAHTEVPALQLLALLKS